MKEGPLIFSESSQTLPSGTNGDQELRVRSAPCLLEETPAPTP